MKTTLSCALFALTSTSLAQQAPPPALEPVVITGSVREQTSHDAPYAITSIDASTLRASGPMVQLSEALVRVPGLAVSTRNNYAQDLQLSSRGFGARAGFGVRGLRLYTDGIPASMPDGQGQVGHFDLAGAQRIEVLRGPFSVMYGTSSGGVIALFTEPASSGRSEGAVDVDSLGLRQMRAQVATPLSNGWDLQVGASHLDVAGFRPHSVASRTLATVRVGQQSPQDRWALLASAQDQPADDPLALTREQISANPDQTAPQASQLNTRKSAQQTQLGSRWQHRFDDAGALRELSVMAYAGQRTVTQFLAIAPAPQSNPQHGGAVVDFDRHYHGAQSQLRWAWAQADLQAGVDVERMVDARRGYENFTGPAAVPNALGVQGALRRDERNTALSQEAYVQGAVRWSDTWQAQAGLRAGTTQLSTQDAFASNGDDSGTLRLHTTHPVAGLSWKLSPRWQLHASAARGVESPTLGELAYRSDGSSGFNTALQPQTSRQLELGSKWRNERMEINATVFRAHTDDEIGVQSNVGGRQSFQNVGRTQRTGAELAMAWQWHRAWRSTLAVTALEARYRDNFFTCTALPCPTPTAPVQAGRQIAGTQKGRAFAELAWRGAGPAPLESGLEWRAQSRTPVNDVNSDYAAGHAVLNLRLQRQHVLAGSPQERLEWLLRVDNLLDRRYVGSVVVNDANGRFFETAAPRSLLLGVRLLHTGW